MQTIASRGGRALPAAVPSLLLAVLAACSRSAAPEPIRYTAIPDRNATELVEKYRVVSDYLAARLGVPFEYVPTTDYGAAYEMFRAGDVQLAWFGGLTGVQAVAAVPGARMIAQGKVDPEFKSYFVVHQSVPIERAEEFPLALAGLRFTFGDHMSTSGRLMPEHFIRLHTGRSPEDFFGMPNAYSGAHDATAKLVEAGTFQAGALNYKTYDQMVAQGKLDPAKCRVVWVTPPYPDYNWTAHPALDERYGAGFVDRLQQALVGASEPAVLEALQRPEGLIPARNEDYAPIRALAEGLGFL